ncbi:MAG: glycosyltransferase family 2 protein [Planctomycetaceae bacterium]|nr:glycosyltransferase family 2 protein [Planctomycetaceae bacterium]
MSPLALDTSKKERFDVHISVVSPIYGSPTLVPELVLRLHQTLATITESYEIVLVFDCSNDNGWEKIRQECQKDRRVKGIHLSRNFGQHYAITAGLTHTKGEWVVVMDCDLQDVPEEIPKLYAVAQDGHDTVFGQRVNRNDAFIKRFLSKAFYSIFSFFTDSKIDPSIANFGIYHHSVIQAVLNMGDHIRFFPTMVRWVGFRQTAVPVVHAARADGKSTYSFRRLFRLAAENIIAFSDKPLRLTIILGFLMSLVSFLFGCYFLLQAMLGKIAVLGFASLIVSLWFLGGTIIFILGIIGIYLGKTFDGVKGRPLFIVDETLNFDNDEL